MASPATPPTQGPPSAPLAPLWNTVNLQLEVAPTVSDCPDQSEFVDWVDQLVGRPFIDETAPTTLHVQVHAAPVEGLRVELLVSRAAASEPAPMLRRFEQVLPCSELLRAAALTVSLYAENPESLVSNAPDSPKDGTLPPPLAPSAGSVDGSSVPPLESPETAPVVVFDAAPAAMAGEPAGPEALRPKVRDRYTAPEVGETRRPDLGLVVGVAGVGALGVNPGVGIGGGAHLGARLSHWDLILAGGYTRSTGRRLPSENNAIVYGPSSELSLSACPMFTGNVALRLCVGGGTLWVYAEGDGFDRDRRALSKTLNVSASAELLFRLDSAVALGTRLQLLVPLAPVRYEVVGSNDAAWTMWPLAPRLFVGLEWD